MKIIIRKSAISNMVYDVAPAIQKLEKEVTGKVTPMNIPKMEKFMKTFGNESVYENIAVSTAADGDEVTIELDDDSITLMFVKTYEKMLPVIRAGKAIIAMLQSFTGLLDEVGKVADETLFKVEPSESKAQRVRKQSSEKIVEKVMKKAFSTKEEV